jgi:hypothetical protein
MKKIFVSGICATTLLFGNALVNPVESHAAELSKINNSGIVDLNNLKALEKTGQITIKDITYDEYVEKTAKSQGISKEEVKRLHPNINQVNTTTQSGEVKALATASDGYSMHEVDITQNVDVFYKPSVQIFVWTYNSGSFREFKYIEDIQLNRGYLGISKQFTGIIKGKLTSGTQIWWYVNGDFYDNGKTTYSVSGAGSMAIKGVTVTGTFSVTNESNHFKYWNNSGTYSAY